jgi:ABC-type oligopeptide transport system substrate-binding subunit
MGPAFAGDPGLVTNPLPEQAESQARDPLLEGLDVPLDFAQILSCDTRRGALREVRTRRALNHAVDDDLLGRSMAATAS